MLTMWSRRNSYLLLVGMQNGTVTLVDNLALSYATNILLPYDRAIVFLSIYPKELKIISTQKPVYGYYTSVIHNCKIMAAIKMSFHR